MQDCNHVSYTVTRGFNITPVRVSGGWWKSHRRNLTSQLSSFGRGKAQNAKTPQRRARSEVLASNKQIPQPVPQHMVLAQRAMNKPANGTELCKRPLQKPVTEPPRAPVPVHGHALREPYMPNSNPQD